MERSRWYAAGWLLVEKSPVVSVWMCVREWVNADLYCEVVEKLEKRFINTVHFTINSRAKNLHFGSIYIQKT